MAIFEKTGETQSITEGSRALELFTDRYKAIRLFLSYLNDDPARENILFFYGDGGNGKSLLLRFLQSHCCKRLSKQDWERNIAKTDEAFIASIKWAGEFEAIPSAMLDFGMPSRDGEQPQEAFSGLLMIRRSLGRSGLRFPLYDFASVLYLHKTGKLSPERLRSLFPSEEMGFISSIADVISQTSYGAVLSATLGIFNKHLREQFTLYMQRRKLSEEQLAAIQRMNPESELIDELPTLFAEDLNIALTINGKHKRIALFFDTHEAFWGPNERSLSDDRFFYRDEWLRRLLGKLEYTTGVVAVVAGREIPRWNDANRKRIPNEFIYLQPVGYLPHSDALQYLQRAGVANIDLQQCLIEYSAVAPDEVHPLYLGLCADVVLAASNGGTVLTAEEFRVKPESKNTGKALIDRLLRYVDKDTEYSIRALSACRAFNRDIYFTLGEALKFQATETRFNILTQFSFVWQPDKQEGGWFRIHKLLQRLFHDRWDEVTQQSHKVLEQYYRKHADSGDTTALAEAIFHKYRLSWEQAIFEWVEVFENALLKANYELCRTLLEVRSRLVIQSAFWQGRVSQVAGRFFLDLARYDEAEKECLAALAAFDIALEGFPEPAGIQMNKGLVLNTLAELDTKFSRYEKAISRYEEALTLFDSVLIEGLNKAALQNNRGMVFTSLGDLFGIISQYDKAFECYKEAIKACNAALEIAPDLIYPLNHKAGALWAMGELQTSLAQYNEALISYEQSIAAYDNFFAHGTDDNLVYNNKGITFVSLGRLQEKLGRQDNALESFKQAIVALDKALISAPDYIGAHNSKGTALLGVGELLAEQSQHLNAISNLKQAIESFQEVVRRAPDMVDAQNNIAIAYRRMGESQGVLGQEEALYSLKQSIVTFDGALKFAPNSPLLHSNKGISFAIMANFQKTLSKYDDAVDWFKQAIDEHDKALEVATNDVPAYINKGSALRGLGDTYANIGMLDKATEAYQASITAHDSAIRLAPDFAACIESKATVHINLAELQFAMQDYQEAARNYKDAVAALDEVNRRNQGDITARINKGIVLFRLGQLQTMLSQVDEARISLLSALNEFAALAEIASPNELISQWRIRVQEVILELEQKQ